MFRLQNRDSGGEELAKGGRRKRPQAPAAGPSGRQWSGRLRAGLRRPSATEQLAADRPEPAAAGAAG